MKVEVEVPALIWAGVQSTVVSAISGEYVQASAIVRDMAQVAEAHPLAEPWDHPLVKLRAFHGLRGMPTRANQPPDAPMVVRYGHALSSDGLELMARMDRAAMSMLLGRGVSATVAPDACIVFT